uniref:Nucleolar protein 8 n=1 Tax=Cyclopterus lumpus TaxID=8103 RepID=A0A8C3AKC5_CYCLU
MKVTMRRLYIGGLSHSITQKDLKDRFGKFGEVEDVELRTRKDDEGVPYKTFSYININISDADLKRCMTVLNKSKWKGGTLQIETAKESFLQRCGQVQLAINVFLLWGRRPFILKWAADNKYSQYRLI